MATVDIIIVNMGAVALPPTFRFGGIDFLSFPIWQIPHLAEVDSPAVEGVLSPTGWRAQASRQAGRAGAWQSAVRPVAGV
ncbi:hypothetical protein DSO57_1025661 [Entomophthora muscae]|uniref:Uncharacterized protein n=1 Tax=Entomophthora muscae TaxID=34485 RepID=A0ACC2TPI1_9FUNG|nr:hypothetical protein DSO57_1025661 [Entomophthora muscae]